ncbi:serine/threonine-protein kinase [Nannocystis sp. SCPEA4]|uniref:serine/threonine-protein kinase n=1 Tax=Nannocystis sp. SCPEA4 TaxID=2996787 RepID=UPI00226DA91C|nr:serine/threonine-protein kinase [Nannocystis sp. SCPEA4]MCY1062039.1 serine/threonine-protein kinase [Nannocystis sp. SCPEA4]
MSSRNSIGDRELDGSADSFSDLAGTDATLLAQIGHAPAVPLDAVDPAPLVPGTVISEQFEIVERIGAGGMAVVYLARDRQLGRPVAIKLQRRPADPGGLSRALREAMAMARLSHPNVLTVHEIGELGPRIYIVMEHIDGWNVRAWLARRPDRGAIVDLFLQAGEGLAAAHAVGIVHRDFKPDNVLVGRDGRVCVGDFGLARVEHEDTAASIPGDTTAALAHPVTVDGAIAGTPAYMAPEQRAGHPVDARADQFAFCVALRESLGPRAPAWLERILRRGSDDQPDRRFASMRALLTAIRREARAARRRPLVLAAVAACIGVGVAAGLGAFDRAPACADTDAALAGVWDAPRRDAVVAAFTAVCTGDGTCPEGLVTRTTTQLDAYADAWTRARVDACEATHVRGEQSPELLDRRMLCLAERLRALDALVDVWMTVDAATAAEAPTAVAALPSVQACADPAHLMARLVPPADPRLAVAVDGVRARLAEATALGRVGRKSAAVDLTRRQLDDDATQAYAPLRAEVDVLLGELQWQSDPEASVRHLESAYFNARAHDHDVVAAHAATHLVWTTGYVRGDAAAAGAWARHALAETERRGAAVHDHVQALNAAASLRSQEGDHLAALALQDQALALLEPSGGAWASVLNNRAAALDALGRYAEASAAYEQVLAEEQRIYGPLHARVAATLGNLGLVRVRQGRFAEAAQLQRSALAVLEQAPGQDRDYRWQALLNLGIAELGDGHPEAGLRAIDEALALATALLGGDNPDVALCLSARASALLRQGRFDEAVTAARDGLDLLQKTYDERHDEVLIQQSVLAEALIGAGREPEAEQWLTRAIAGWDARSDGDHPQLAQALVLLGNVLRRGGRIDEAAAAYARALGIADRSEVEPELKTRAAAGLDAVAARDRARKK